MSAPLRRILLAVLVVVTVSPVISRAAPPNDNFDDATPMTVPGVATIQGSNATLESGENTACTFRTHGASVWFSFTVERAQHVLVRTVPSPSRVFNSLAVYRGLDVSTATMMACTVGQGTTADAVLSVFASPGETYRVQVLFAEPHDSLMQLVLAPTMAGDIAGRVVDTAGAPIRGICVATIGFPAFEAWTDDDGRYRFSLEPGNHRIRFRDCRNLGYADEYYDDSVSFSGARDLFVVPGQVTADVDATLVRVAAITGRIDGVLGDRFLDPCVYAWQEGTVFGDVFTSVHSQGDGTYAFLRLHPGRYRIKFDDCPFGNADEITGEWFDDQPHWSSAVVLDLAEGARIEGIDETLTRTS